MDKGLWEFQGERIQVEALNFDVMVLGGGAFWR